MRLFLFDGKDEFAYVVYVLLFVTLAPSLSCQFANFVIFLHLLLNLHGFNGLPAAIGGLLSDDDIPAESMAIQQRTESTIQVH